MKPFKIVLLIVGICILCTGVAWVSSKIRYSQNEKDWQDAESKGLGL